MKQEKKKAKKNEKIINEKINDEKEKIVKGTMIERKKERMHERHKQIRGLERRRRKIKRYSKERQA